MISLWAHTWVCFMPTYKPETDRNIGIVSKVPIPRLLVSVSVSIQGFLESRYQYQYRSRGWCIFCKVLTEFLLSKVSVSIPVQFHGISIRIGLDVDWVRVSVSVSVSIQGPIKYQYRLEICGPVCLWLVGYKLPEKWRKNPVLELQSDQKWHFETDSPYYCIAKALQAFRSRFSENLFAYRIVAIL